MKPVDAPLVLFGLIYLLVPLLVLAGLLTAMWRVF